MQFFLTTKCISTHLPEHKNETYTLQKEKSDPNRFLSVVQVRYILCIQK